MTESCALRLRGSEGNALPVIDTRLKRAASRDRHVRRAQRPNERTRLCRGLVPIQFRRIGKFQLCAFRQMQFDVARKPYRTRDISSGRNRHAPSADFCLFIDARLDVAQPGHPGDRNKRQRPAQQPMRFPIVHILLLWLFKSRRAHPGGSLEKIPTIQVHFSSPSLVMVQLRSKAKLIFFPRFSCTRTSHCRGRTACAVGVWK